MYTNTERDISVETMFDKIAGAAFAIGWLNSLAPAPTSIEAPLFGWLLTMNALATLDANISMVERINTDFDGLIVQPSDVSREIGQQFRTKFATLVQQEWGFWLPPLLFLPKPEREQQWNMYDKRFPSSSLEERALRKLLFALLDEPCREDLFTIDGRGRYTSQAEAVVIQVGKLLKELKTTEDELQQVFSRWYEFTREVLNRVHSGVRVSRALRPDASEYIDLLLALLAVAEWRSQPDIWRIPTFIESYQQYKEEAFTSRQLALSSVLFGYFEGYHRVAAGIQQLPLRRLLAGQAMAFIAMFYIKDVIGDPCFYFSSKTSDLDTNWIMIDEIESEYTTHYRYQRKGVEHKNISKHRTSMGITIADVDLTFSSSITRDGLPIDAGNLHSY